MRFSSYLLLLLSFTLVFWMAGGTPINDSLWHMAGITNTGSTPSGISGNQSQILTACQNTTAGVFNESAACNQVSSLSSANNPLISNTLMALVGALGVGALITGFGAIYIIPIAILLAINVYILPIGGILATTGSAFPPIIGIPLVAFMNLLMCLAYINFIRGGT